jgi:hypothetical protein
VDGGEGEGEVDGVGGVFREVSVEPSVMIEWFLEAQGVFLSVMEEL